MNKFFKNNEERNLWIRLNAERIQYYKKRKNLIEVDLGELNDNYSCMQVSLNQLEYDENKCDKLRFSFEQLLTLTQEQLFVLAENRICDEISRLYESFFRFDT